VIAAFGEDRIGGDGPEWVTCKYLMTHRPLLYIRARVETHSGGTLREHVGDRVHLAVVARLDGEPTWAELRREANKPS
jgi:hypothetical protein